MLLIGMFYSKGKGKFHPIQAIKALDGEKKYSSTHSLPRRQEGMGGQHHALAALPPGKTRYPLYRRLGGRQGRSGRVRKISPPLGFDPRPSSP
jgi:hypothetical protein